jgi:uncharacterized repeat protein (TIGR03803 family)
MSFSSRVRITAVLVMTTFAPMAVRAQAFSTLINFNFADGAGPLDSALVQGEDGDLYGTTSIGGEARGGIVYKITAASQMTILHSFCSEANCSDGLSPSGGLLLGADGNFYGTTEFGGPNDAGTIFQITPDGTLFTLHIFTGGDGALPRSPLIQAANGDFYGVTPQGGANNWGTIFKMSPNGTLTTLYSFIKEQAEPSLVQATDGNFYGTTADGGANNRGTIFRLTPSGGFGFFHSFDCSDGCIPYAGLVQGSDGYLYGNTSFGGLSTNCENGCGTAFRISLSGELTTIHNFDSSDGADPTASLIQATDGNFYGTTVAGGTYGKGTVIQITPDGVVTTLHSFRGNDGDQPYGPISQATSGKLHGTTYGGTGTAAEGTVFSVSTDIGPFVSFVRNIGKSGQVIGILGQGFKGTTGVSFQGTSAAFRVRSDTYITATVPAGATTGLVTVTTPVGTLTSNAAFTVKP